MSRILDTRTGVVFEVDPHLARLARMRRRVFAWAKLIETLRYSDAPAQSMKMITLTYKRVGQWRPNHIREFMYRVRHHLGERINAYAWVAELQKRGAVHYHLLVVHGRGRGLPRPDDAGWWPHGMTRIEKVRTPYYVAKYTSKGNIGAAQYPKGCRMFGLWFNPGLATLEDDYRSLRLTVHPRWLLEIINADLDWREVRRWPGGGYRVGDELVQSPYRYLPD